MHRERIAGNQHGTTLNGCREDSHGQIGSGVEDGRARGGRGDAGPEIMFIAAALKYEGRLRQPGREQGD